MMPAPYPISITLDGKPYSGTWHLMLDGRLCVRSAWGNDAVDCCAGTRPEALARKTLERIVRAYHKRQAKERAQQEREMAKLRRKTKSPATPKRDRAKAAGGEEGAGV